MAERIGRYEILDRIGRGGMGVLYRGRDPRLDRIVAIKVLPSDLDIDETTRSRFVREAMSAARLQHRNIVTVFEFAEEQGAPYIVMEFLHGRSLAARLAQEPALTLEESLDVVIQLCTGLDYAHEQGVVHRDVKPGNIWLQDDGAVKLLDFGIARVAASTLTRHGEVVGSASYVAPEQIRGLPVDGRADVFSAGIVLFELLAGRRPFEAETPTAIINLLLDNAPAPVDALPPSVPAAVRDAVARALQKNADQRYARASDFAADLQIATLELGSHSDTLIEDGTTTVVVFDDPAKTIYAPPTAAERSAAAAGAVDFPIRPPSWQPPAETAKAPSRKTLLTLGAVASVVALAGWAWTVVGRTDGKVAPPANPIVPADPPTPKPPPPPPTVEEIELQSSPPDASILRDGQDTGLRTPAKVALADVRAGTLRLTAAGYLPVDVRPADAADGATRAVVKLRPVETPVQVSIQGSYPFRVHVGPRALGPSDAHQFTVNGRQSFRISAPEYFLERTVHVGSGPRQNLSAPGLGKVDVRSSNFDACMVSIHGRDVDYPNAGPRAIAAGSYTVRLVKCPDGQNRQQDIVVEAGEVKRVIFK